MNRKTKDRLMTAGTVLVICSLGVSLPGCSTAVPFRDRDPPVSIVRIKDTQCTTDFDCEMHAQRGSTHIEWSWKRVAGIAMAAVVTGYLLSHDGHSSNTSSITSAGPPTNVPTPGVNCVDSGCAR